MAREIEEGFEKAAAAVDGPRNALERREWLRSIAEYKSLLARHDRAMRLLERAWITMGTDGNHTSLEEEIRAFLFEE